MSDAIGLGFDGGISVHAGLHEFGQKRGGAQDERGRLGQGNHRFGGHTVSGRIQSALLGRRNAAQAGRETLGRVGYAEMRAKWFMKGVGCVRIA